MGKYWVSACVGLFFGVLIQTASAQTLDIYCCIKQGKISKPYPAPAPVVRGTSCSAKVDGKYLTGIGCKAPSQSVVKSTDKKATHKEVGGSADEQQAGSGR